MTAGRSKKPCPICIIGVSEVDYKDLNVLKQFVSQYGKVVPRYYTGACVWHQKRMSNAIKRAREVALLPYVK